MLPFKHHSNIVDNIELFDKVLTESKPKTDIIFNKNEWCPELRGTTWMSDDLSITLEYSEKIMQPINLTPSVQIIRTKLKEKFGIYFDSVLVNYYPDGNIGMRYHSDPINKWDTNFMIVSLGDTRKLIFREIKNFDNKYNFDMNHGDCIHMFDDCQDLFQHSVRKNKSAGPRISLVFKKLKTI